MAAALGAGGGGGGDEAVGTARNPLVITHAEPSVGSQLLRLVRSLALAFILVTAVGAFLDEKSLTKGMMSNPDLKPQMESNTKWGASGGGFFLGGWRGRCGGRGVAGGGVWGPRPGRECAGRHSREPGREGFFAGGARGFRGRWGVGPRRVRLGWLLPPPPLSRPADLL
jgi:hypothetical protein